MGNWKTVNMIGTCGAEEVDDVKSYITVDYDDEESLKRVGPLSFYGSVSICGINMWPAEKISAIGNLSERDYNVDDLAEQLRELRKIAPSLRLQIHCGGDWESTDCVASVVCDDSGVCITSPGITTLMSIPIEQMEGNLARALRKEKL